MLFRRKRSSDGNAEPNPYEIWQAQQAENETAEIAEIERDKNGKGYLRWLNPVTYISGFWSSLLDDNRREAIKVIISMFGILATASAAVGLIWTVWDATEDRKLTQERLITDRFSKAATLLSEDDKAVRIAAIYSLERLAKDSPQDHWTIMELLSAYVLEKSPLVETEKVSKPTPTSKNTSLPEVKKESIKSSDPITNDVQAALTVIGRRSSDQDQGWLDLTGRNLSGANLRYAKLRYANLRYAKLSYANLRYANLRWANLRWANLRYAKLSYANLFNANLFNANLIDAEIIDANLSWASLTIADLSDANLLDANLSHANLSGANLSDADLSGANLSGTDLSHANLSGARNLKPSQIKSATNWRNAKYDDAMRKKLGLPPEPSKDKAKDTPNKPQPTSSPSPSNPVTSP